MTRRPKSGATVRAVAFIWQIHAPFFRGLELQPADYRARAALAVRRRLIELAAGHQDTECFRGGALFDPPDEAAEKALRQLRATERELASFLAFPARRL